MSEKQSQSKPLLVASSDDGSSPKKKEDNDTVTENESRNTLDGIAKLADGRQLGFMIHNLQGSKNVIFIPGAGFGRTANPCIYDTPNDPKNILSALDVRLIIFDKPGYGQSTFLNDNQRSLKQWADDIEYVLLETNQITQYLTKMDKKNSKDDESKENKENKENDDNKENKDNKENERNENNIKIDWIAHSAGCPHLLAIMYHCKELLMKFESNIAIVSSPNPLMGKVENDDRPNETTCERKVQRCCALNCLCCLLCMFKPLLQKWKDDSSKFMQFSEKEFLNQQAFKDYQWITNDETFKHLFFDKMSNDFDAAISKAVDNKGADAMRQDMFLIPVNDWGFKIKDISLKNNDKFQSKIHVWYGVQDHATPNGDWIHQQLSVNSDGLHVIKHKENGHGHGIIHSRFNDILTLLIRD